MKRVHITLIVFGLSLFLVNCKKDGPIVDLPYEPPAGTSVIPTFEQRSGDASIGREYLITGDYLNSGIPYDVFLLGYGEDNSNLLGRTGDNTKIRHDFTAVDAPNGVRIVAPNCLHCHASMLNGELVVGLGNSAGDFTTDQGSLIPLLSAGITTVYGANSPEWNAYESFMKSTLAIGPEVITQVKGANPADKIGGVLAAYRDKETLVWNDVPSQPITPVVVITDVPPWWVLKKKNAMFYSGNGRGDFSKYLLASALLTMADSSKANEINLRFPDILAFINSIEPPEYPQSIDMEKMERGKSLFAEHCSSCHGTYGEEEFYPNLLVPIDLIGTDPVLSLAYQTNEYSYFKDWINTGWFGSEPNPAELTADDGYVAQPLDGIWASAPYLHNGSVPTLDDLLNSSQRPTYWKRSFDMSDLNYEKVGWNYTVEGSKTDTDTYDTTLLGYGNQGHLFGDILSDTERAEVIEYLKTL